eukprot:CAMPEP_0198323404 /NCGR_PEP_ID=MMETSP1450-20131203/11656_1 /TAXON_ID=753684 ORGANISM="Madagascaria erythrocladiodes, Strain CCMP3234" /NCGR_SAMPLE_ID=MMETSP1450 /ASSEMBLY_ACC=CAM_ASM_001115 /LENGTH=398 /DNA_ID=CAMNT_0044027101 /DNA_START=133 /DNA_END=1329 /DNA_ORIENTATION=+
MKDLTLTETEESLVFRYLECVGTLTTYQGRPPSDFLRQRVRDIVKLNPWLAGRLVAKKKLVLTYSDQPGPDDRIFTVAEDACLDVGASFEQANAAVSSYLVKRGNYCVGTDEPLFKVVLIPNIPGSPTQQFGIVVSMNHIIGDGHTYYRIFGMLSDREKPYPLNPERFPGLRAESAELLGAPASVFTIPSINIGLLRRMITRKNHKCIVKFINMDEVKRIKKEHQLDGDPEVPFISTNDIISAWFLSEARADHGLMAINMRNRIPSVSDCDAGNYENMLSYAAGDQSYSPADVRRSLMQPGRQLPSTWSAIFGRSVVISSWATLDRSVHFEGCRQTVHVPLGSPAGVPFDQVAVVFKPTEDTLAVSFTVDEGTCGFAADNAAILGEDLSLEACLSSSF